jgi:hypothetical protein
MGRASENLSSGQFDDVRDALAKNEVYLPVMMLRGYHLTIFSCRENSAV